MTSERWRDVHRLVAGALALSPEERRAYLDKACADAALRRDVDALIAARKAEAEAPGEPGVAATVSSRTTIGPYEITGLLGAGGMGVVYRARDARLDRDVAIKVLPPHAIADESARKRFRKEALALAKVNHQSIAAVYDVGEAQGTDYLVMEYVPGQSLAQRIRSGPLPVVDALALGAQVAAALQEAHDRGIVHRDLKPSNIIVTPKGHAKVLDFGLATFSSVPEAARIDTMSGTRGIVGTPLYMSPEQAEGARVDARTDVWSLGALLYEALGGRPPFDGSTLTLLRAISETPPTPLRELRPDVPEDVERIVARALEKAGRNATSRGLTWAAISPASCIG